MANEVKMSLSDYDKMRNELQRYREAVKVKDWGGSIEVQINLKAFSHIIEDLVEEEYPNATMNDRWEDNIPTSYVASINEEE